MDQPWWAKVRHIRAWTGFRLVIRCPLLFRTQMSQECRFRLPFRIQLILLFQIQTTLLHLRVQQGRPLKGMYFFKALFNVQSRLPLVLIRFDQKTGVLKGSCPLSFFCLMAFDLDVCGDAVVSRKTPIHVFSIQKDRTLRQSQTGSSPLIFTNWRTAACFLHCQNRRTRAAIPALCQSGRMHLFTFKLIAELRLLSQQCTSLISDGDSSNGRVHSSSTLNLTELYLLFDCVCIWCKTDNPLLVFLLIDCPFCCILSWKSPLV